MVVGFLNVLELGASGDRRSQKLRCLTYNLPEITMLNIILPELVSPIKLSTVEKMSTKFLRMNLDLALNPVPKHTVWPQ